jgi:hypothetical protein
MHLLILILQHLLGMLPSGKTAPQAELARVPSGEAPEQPRQVNRCADLASARWMTAPSGRRLAGDSPPRQRQAVSAWCGFPNDMHRHRRR